MRTPEAGERLVNLTPSIQLWKSQWVDATTQKNDAVISLLRKRQNELQTKIITIVRTAVALKHKVILGDDDLRWYAELLLKTDS